MYRDYYPEYNHRGNMNFSDELSDLKYFYKERMLESFQCVDQGFDILVDKMEDFVRDYRAHVKYCEAYNNLKEKMQENRIEEKSGDSLLKFFNGFNSQEDDEDGL